MPVIANPNGPGFIDVAEGSVPPPAPISTTPEYWFDPNGQLNTVPADSISQAQAAGWRKATDAEVAKELAIKQQVNQTSPLAGAADTFLNEASGGVKRYAEEHDKTPEQKEIDAEARRREFEQNPLLTAGAFVAGNAANIAATEGLGALARGVRGATEAADLARTAVEAGKEQSLVNRIGTSAYNYAKTGFVYSSPLAATQLAYGDPGSAAETLLWGTGLSGALGAGAGLVGAGADTLAHGAGELAESIGNRFTQPQANGLTFAENIGRKLLGFSDATVKDLGPEKVSRMVEIAEDITHLDPAKQPAAIEDMVKESQEAIKEYRANFDPDNAPIPAKAAATFQSELIKATPDIFTNPEINKVANEVYDEIVEGGSNPSYTAMDQIQQSLEKKLIGSDPETPTHSVYQLAYNIVKQDNEIAAQNYFNKGNQPDKFADYLLQLERHETGMQLLQNQNVNKFAGTGLINIPNVYHAGAAAYLGRSLLHTVAPGLGVGVGIATNYAIKAFIQNRGGLLGKSVSFIRRAAENPRSLPLVGGLLAKEGQSALTQHLNSIPGILSGSKILPKAATDVYQHLIGNNVGLTKQQQYDKLTQAIQQATIEVNATADRMGHVASPYTATSPLLGSTFIEKNLTALTYLSNSIPRNPTPPRPFQGKDDWQPTTQQQREFLDKVAIVHDPIVVWQHYQQGKLGKTDREVMQAVYPQIYSQMVNKILQTAYDPRAKALTYEQRMQLSTFTGLPLDQSLKNINAIQGAITMPTVQAMPPASAPKRRGGGSRASGHPNFTHMPSLETEVQRRTYGRGQ